jgi:tetratricopeptide (TPR) repeat protein
MRKLLFISAVLLLTVWTSVTAQDGGGGGHGNPETKKLTAAEWRADLRFYAAEMPKRHRNLFFTMSKEDFEKAVADLDKRIPNLERHEIVAGLMRITAMVGDGHTRLRAELQFGSQPVFPVRFYRFDDGLFVRAAAPEHKDLVGSKVVKIGNMTAGEALHRAGELTSADNAMGKLAMGPVLLSVPAMTDALGITDGFETLPVTVEKDGKVVTMEVKPAGNMFDLLRQPENWIDARTGETPLYRKQPENNYWYEYLPEKKTVYVKYNAVQNKPDETIAAFFEKVYDFVEKNPVEKFVIDMRDNGGGNNSLNKPIYLGLIRSKLNEKGKAFAIIGRGTFSAAQNGVNKLEELTNITFIGEPTAANPNHYGDARPFTLPNSGLVVMASTLWWQDKDPRDDRQWTAPEIAVEPTFADYRAGRDPALEAVFEYESGISYADLVREATDGDFAVFVKKYREFKNDPRRKYYDTQSDMNRFGYQLLNANNVDRAIEVFKLNVEFYPASANVYDSLAEAYLAKGNKELAIKNYEKALELSPGYPSAEAALKKLKAGN